MPSAAILAAIARVLDVELAVLLDVSAAKSRSAHVLLYQDGAGRQSPLPAVRNLFAGEVAAWIEILDPRLPEAATSLDDVLLTKRGPLGSSGSDPLIFQRRRTIAALSDLLAKTRRTDVPPRLGVIFGANSAALRSSENPLALLESETTWEDDVRGEFQAALGIEPIANVCVYRRADIEELATRIDPLATVVDLICTHTSVAVQDEKGEVTTGPAAIEMILTSTRPTGVSSTTWESLARAAAVGLAREAPTARPLATPPDNA
jgi:hypothetical protein